MLVVIKHVITFVDSKAFEAGFLSVVFHLLFFVIRVVLLLIVLFHVLFVCKCLLPPGVNPIAVDKYINININTSCIV
jgi:hypothetical protein